MTYCDLNPGPRETEDTPEFARLVETFGYWSPVGARGYARVMGHPTYPGGCDQHGEVIASTATGACLQCTGYLRQGAREAGRRNYKHHCYACARTTAHRTRDEQCLECTDSRGASARADARRRGLTVFVADCPAHGAADHSVKHGGCLTCRTTGGELRRNVADGARAAARAEGRRTYTATCWLHGAVDHSVPHGKCLTCFNAMGRERPAMRPATVRTRNPRAEARNAGQWSYTFFCDACNDDVDHSVAHGKCLTCFSTAGKPRTRKVYAPREHREEDDFVSS